jgi:hypothetical protein
MRMIRLLIAAAMTALLAGPAMAQSVSPGTPGSSPQDQGSPDSLSRSPGQIPADCTPTDARPECQTAQLPGQESPGSSLPAPSAPGVMMPPAERSESDSAPSSPPGSEGSGPDGGIGR